MLFVASQKGSYLIHGASSLIRQSDSLIRTEQGFVRSALELQYK
jgi:hypothetical protein